MVCGGWGHQDINEKRAHAAVDHVVSQEDHDCTEALSKARRGIRGAGAVLGPGLRRVWDLIWTSITYLSNMSNLI